AETDRLGFPAGRRRMDVHQRLDLPPRLALEKIGDAARQMQPLAMDDETGTALAFFHRHRAAPTRLMHDEMGCAAKGNLYARPHLRALRDLGEALFQPSLMAMQEFFHVRLPEAGRHGDAQPLPSGID